jgi:hypothetical protein
MLKKKKSYLGKVSITLTSSKSVRVPNIKFNVAKVLKSLVPILDQSVSSSGYFASCYRFEKRCVCISALLGNIVNAYFAGRGEDRETMPC